MRCAFILKASMSTRTSEGSCVRRHSTRVGRRETSRQPEPFRWTSEGAPCVWRRVCTYHFELLAELLNPFRSDLILHVPVAAHASEVQPVFRSREAGGVRALTGPCISRTIW
jgi:hypothetical protein